MKLRSKIFYSLSNISIMKRSVWSPDKTPRRELKIRRPAEYFWRTSRCFIWWWNTVSNAWYYFSNKMVLEGEIKDSKKSSFSSDFQTLIKHLLKFPCIFFLNYEWVWEVNDNTSIRTNLNCLDVDQLHLLPCSSHWENV